MRFLSKKGASLIEVLVAGTLLVVAATTLVAHFAKAARSVSQIEGKGREMDIRKYVREFLDCPATFSTRPFQCDLGGNIDVKSREGGNLISASGSSGVEFPGFNVRAKCTTPGANHLRIEISENPQPGELPVWRDLYQGIPITCGSASGGFAPPVVVNIPLECAHVVYNGDFAKLFATTYPQYEKNCKISFNLTQYYPAALNQIFSKFEVDFKSYGWMSMAPNLGEGYFTDLGVDALGNNRECDTRLSDRAAGFVSAPFITLSSSFLGYYYADPNPTSPLPTGAGSKETNLLDWLTPLNNGYRHERFRVEYTPTARHRFYFEYKLNGWGSCSFTNGCGACMSNIVLKLYK